MNSHDRWRHSAARLPIGQAIDPLLAALDTGRRAVLHAPPGAGKTTIVPLALAEQAWCTGTVVMLEPRRLSVRSAARRLASLVEERPGQSVGWRMRNDTKVGPATRIEVVTEGVLTRRIQRDPELSGVSAVVFDEFHERSLDADVGLAFSLETADAFRPDLRIVVMSATLDIGPLADLLDAPVIAAQSREHPVEIVQIDTDRRAAIEPGVVAACRRALSETTGDVLVFLPGAREIERCHSALATADAAGSAVIIHRLHGALPRDEQDAALAPASPGARKIVVATAVAETSLTIEGVTAVVDAGWRRTARFDPGTGMSRLVTLPVTRAQADQRAGRAGRLGPGVAYRLWGAADDAHLRPHPEPEMVVADLSGLALDLAVWGSKADDLAWLDPPPSAHLAAAQDLLRTLGAVDADGRPTDMGLRMAEVPAHPRLAHLLLAAADRGLGATGADVAATLADSRRRSRRVDLSASLARGLGADTRGDARRFRALAGVDPGSPFDATSIGFVAALGFPDRIGRRRGDKRGEFLLANGTGAFCPTDDPLADTEYLCVLDSDGDRRRARIRTAVGLTESEVAELTAGRVVESVSVSWDPIAGDVRAERRRRFGAVTLASAPIRHDEVDPAAFTVALVDGIETSGVGILPWTDDSRSLQQRIEFLRRALGDDFAAAPVDDETLRATATTRIAPHLAGMRRRRDLREVDVAEILLDGLNWEARRSIDRLAPERIVVPSGHRHRVDYGSYPPVLAVKLQEMFGATTTPTVADGRVALVVHLLSPAGRPLQVTQDLPAFWSGAYADVRAEMRGRYPKHPWPEDPATAEPTARTTRRR